MSQWTFQFKEIFPNLESFKEFLSSQSSNYVNNNLEEMYVNSIYFVLFNRYANSEICYETIDEFKMRFSVIFFDFYNSFQKSLKMIDLINKLEEDDLLTLNEMINNQALNSNEPIENPRKPIDFVSNQNYSLQISNKLDRYLYFIDSLKENNFDYIIKRFKPLFLPIHLMVHELYERS